MKLFRRSLRVLALLSAACLGVAVCDAQNAPVRILPLGDSLTSGVTTGTTVEGAYRNRLFSLLTTAGYNVDFVGTQIDANNPTLVDRNHQGMGGFRIDQIQSGLSSWLNVIEDPDVVLLMIGTNDFSQNFDVPTAQARLSSLVTDIATKRPFAKIILSNLPLRTDSATLENQQSVFNAAIPGIVNAQTALGRQVSFLDMHSVLLAGDFTEGVHPTASGYGKMADAWLPAITSVITPSGTSNPPAIVRTEPAVDLQHLTVKFSKPLADSSTALANFSLNGGLTISQALLDPVTKRSITLTTSSQASGRLYTLTVSGVRDRTPAQTLIAPGSTVGFSSLTLSNGSFEAGETGWTMTGNRLNYASDGTYVATDGVKMMVLNGGNTLPNAIFTQTITTVPGQFYVLSFDVGILGLNASGQQLGVSVEGSGSLVAQIEPLPGNGQGVSVWSGKSYAFTANSTSAILTFQDQSSSSNGVDLLLDNVRIIAAPLPVNNPPVAAGESYSTNQNTPLVIAAPGVLANDSDAQSSPLTAILNAGPTHGILVLNADGGFTYTPASGYVGLDSFSYRANDGSLDSNIATVNLAVNAVVPGNLVNGSFEAGQTGWTMTGNFLVYDTNPPYAAFDGVKMVVMNGGQTPPNAIVTQTFATTPGQSYVLDFNVGSLASNFAEQKLGVSVTGSTQRLAVIESIIGNNLGNSAWTAKSYPFTADSTSTTLTFQDQSTTSDGLDLLLDNVRITTSAPPNTAPVAVAESYSTNQNTALIVNAPGVLSNDTDAQSNPLIAVLGTGPANGLLALNPNGSFTYTPATGYSGLDSFTYRANDGTLNSNSVTVSLTINAVNTAPVAAAESYSTPAGTALVIAAPGVLSNDTDAQSNPLTAVLASGPTNGLLVLNPNGGFTYTPTSGYSGADSFTYRANDGNLNSNLATVSLNVTTANVQVLANGSFESGFSGWTKSGNLTIESTSPYPPTDGVKLLACNSRNLAPNGLISQTFATVPGKTYALSFDMGALGYVKKQMQLTVTVTGVGSLLSQTTSLQSLSNGSTVWSAKSYTFVANSASTILSFQDRSAFTDGVDLLLDKVRVVGPPAVVNSAPVAVADIYSVNKNTALVVPAAGVLANDTDPQSDALTAVLVAAPVRGVLALNANGSFTYTPNTGFVGADSFTYRANDGSLNSSTVTVSISVNEVNPGILVNGSFESNFDGWTTTGNQSIGYYPATEGIKIVSFNNDNKTPDGVLSQTFATTPGQSYSLSFDASVLAYTTDAQILRLSVTGTGSLLNQTVTINGLGDGLGAWFPQNFNFVANSTTSTLTFRDESIATVGIDLLLDNVRVLAIAGPTVALLTTGTPGEPPLSTATPTLTSTPTAFTIRMTAPQDGTYLLERSEDLLSWKFVASMPCAAQQLVEFFDTRDALSSEAPKKQMFYRIGLQPAQTNN